MPKTPHDGQVWTDPADGRPLLFVRDEPEHHIGRFLFLATSDRVVFERRLSEVPDAFELVADPKAMQRADATLALMAEMEREHRGALAEVGRKVSALEAAMKRAVATVTPTVAQELRRVYRETLDKPFTR